MPDQKGPTRGKNGRGAPLQAAPNRDRNRLPVRTGLSLGLLAPQQLQPVFHPAAELYGRALPGCNFHTGEEFGIQETPGMRSAAARCGDVEPVE